MCTYVYTHADMCGTYACSFRLIHACMRICGGFSHLGTLKRSAPNRKPQKPPLDGALVQVVLHLLHTASAADECGDGAICMRECVSMRAFVRHKTKVRVTSSICREEPSPITRCLIAIKKRNSNNKKHKIDGFRTVQRAQHTQPLQRAAQAPPAWARREWTKESSLDLT